MFRVWRCEGSIGRKRTECSEGADAMLLSADHICLGGFGNYWGLK